MKTTTNKGSKKQTATLELRVIAADLAWGRYIEALKQGRADAAELKRIWQEME